MRKRGRMYSRHSRRLFSRTARRNHKKNRMPRYMRGGIRL